MKIDATGPLRPTSSIRRGERGALARPGEFVRHLESENAGAAVSASHPIGSVALLLALHSVDDPTAGRSRARRRAQDMLDRLDDLRRGLLAGVVSRSALAELAFLARAKREPASDAHLHEILDEIELRAEVELAKLADREAAQ
ncbi:MAG: flagellar assembly protein FliX [Pseudomonadota bacterium]